jgi:hypothetical protein
MHAQPTLTLRVAHPPKNIYSFHHALYIPKFLMPKREIWAMLEKREKKRNKEMNNGHVSEGE